MLPILATVFGSRHFGGSRFVALFEKLEDQYRSAEREELRRLDMLMRWLADQTSLESALEQVGQVDVRQCILPALVPVRLKCPWHPSVVIRSLFRCNIRPNKSMANIY